MVVGVGRHNHDSTFNRKFRSLALDSQSGGQFFGIHASNDGKIMIFAGGIPLKREGK